MRPKSPITMCFTFSWLAAVLERQPDWAGIGSITRARFAFIAKALYGIPYSIKSGSAAVRRLSSDSRYWILQKRTKYDNFARIDSVSFGEPQLTEAYNDAAIRPLSSIHMGAPPPPPP